MATAVLLSSAPALADRIALTQNWTFHAGAADGAEAPGYNDSTWQNVSVPHDWSIHDKADGTPFDRTATAGQDSGYLPGGVGWYRRDLMLDAEAAKGVVRLIFEAVYMDADIWVNGVHIAKHHYGYTAFALDLTGKLKPGRNVVAVRVNHVDPSSRWYAGSGIIRPVHLETLDRVHIDPDGLTVATPTATSAQGQVVVKTPVANRTTKPAAVVLTTAIIDGAGRRVKEETQRQTIKAGSTAIFDHSLTVDNPALWSPESPNLYRLEQTVQVGTETVDRRSTRFGIRTLTVDSENGIRLNGQPVELRGGNIHHDNYMLGAAGWPDADARKVALMKAAGYNAIRSAHNPASQATLDAADELGMLVVNEAFDMWNKPKRARDYARFFKTDWQQDLDSLIISGRNHPSVIMWSIGNEIPEQGAPEGVATARQLVARVKALDPTRPVTQGTNIDSAHGDPLFAELDVAGYNYRAHLFAKDHTDHPKRIMYTSESTSKNAFPYWRAVETMPSVVGDFVWTAVDYLGETGIGWMGYSRDWQKLGPFPWHLAYCGEIDATGRKRPAAFYREVLWKTGITPISAFVHQPEGTEDLPDRNLFTPPAELDWSLDDVHESWTWAGQEGKPLDVVVYSEFPEVELRLNGKSLGRKLVDVSTEYKANFQAVYAPGTLTAIGYRDGKPAGQWELRTAGAPAAARVSSDRSQVRANGRDLAYVAVQLTDTNGVPIYAQTGDRDIRFKVSGAGKLAGAGSGNPQRAASLTSGHLTTFHGRAVAVVQADAKAGPIHIDVVVDGLPGQRMTLQAVNQ